MSILTFPSQINGINYKLIDEYNKIYNECINKETSVIDNINRLEPPYLISCSHLNISGCQKKAAFKLTFENKYYCWYHMHCNE